MAAELHFHHLDPNAKERCISDLVNCSRSRIIAEVNKCVVLCANCHLRLHAKLIQVDESALCHVDDDLKPCETLS